MVGEQSKLWDLNVIPPALFFWGGGLLVWCTSDGWNLETFIDWFKNLEGLNSSQAVFLFLFFVLFLIVSTKLVEWIQSPLIRFAEGYWPIFPLNKLGDYLVNHLRSKMKPKILRYDDIGRKYENLKDPKSVAKGPSDSERIEFAKLETELNQYPNDMVLPTKFGNIIRAAEEYPSDCYGLETMRVWPDLWLLLPDRVRDELSKANKDISERITWFFWVSSFSLWTIVAWAVWDKIVLWPLFVAFFGTVSVYYLGLIPAASNFGDLLRASFDLHRFAVYEALHLPLPFDPNDEDKDGENLSQYLKHGIHPDVKVLFTHSEIKK
ncbi:hypothetical protein [Methanosarcina sp. 1.H.T.1A.1]|uniref:hypothetical protein n=1 Tax=Methanosarcina sp. 1.H.T.1A.1 TaxID=1483602 RepID=UPI0012E0452C|nr:hypothetical protein [Methanosarcina sp. 1.H.T.1A.1]